MNKKLSLPLAMSILLSTACTLVPVSVPDQQGTIYDGMTGENRELSSAEYSNIRREHGAAEHASNREYLLAAGLFYLAHYLEAAL